MSNDPWSNKLARWSRNLFSFESFIFRFVPNFNNQASLYFNVVKNREYNELIPANLENVLDEYFLVVLFFQLIVIFSLADI